MDLRLQASVIRAVVEFNALSAVGLPDCQIKSLAGDDVELWQRLIGTPVGAARMSTLIRRRLNISNQVRIDELVDARAKFGLLPGTHIVRLLSFAASAVQSHAWCNLVQQQDREQAKQGLGEPTWEFVTQRSRLTIGPLGKRYGAAIDWKHESGNVETMLTQHALLQANILHDLIDDRSASYTSRVHLKLPKDFSSMVNSARVIAREEAWTLMERLIQQELEPRWQSCFG